MMAAADTAMILAICTHLGRFQPMTTVQLQTSFLRLIPGDSGTARVVARVLRMGRKLVFGEIQILDARGELAAHATTTYALVWNTGQLDYRTAFELAPIGLVLSRQRLMIDCNRQVRDLRRHARADGGPVLRMPVPDARRVRAHRRAHRREPGCQRLVCRRARDEAPGQAAAQPASCSGAMSAAARSTRGSRMPPASGPSRTCRRGARCKVEFHARESARSPRC